MEVCGNKEAWKGHKEGKRIRNKSEKILTVNSDVHSGGDVSFAVLGLTLVPPSIREPHCLEDEPTASTSLQRPAVRRPEGPGDARLGVSRRRTAESERRVFHHLHGV